MVQENIAFTRPIRILKGALIVFIRLLAAFVCGWLLILLLDKTGIGIFFSISSSSVIIAILFFLLLGIAAAWTVNRQNKHIMSLALATAVLSVAGMYAYWYPLASQADATELANCAAINDCNVAGSLYRDGLFFSLIPVLIIVLLSACITAFVRKRQARELEIWGRQARESEV